MGVLEGDSSPLVVGESSIIIGTIEDGCGFTVFILVFFRALKYIDVCLFLFCFGLIGVLRVMRAANASLYRVSGDTYVFSAPFSSPSVFFSVSAGFVSFCSVLVSSSFVLVYSFFVLVSSSFPYCSSVSSPSPPCCSSSSLSEGLRSYVRAFISSSYVMFLKISHAMGLVKVWRASSTNSLINPW